MSSSSPLALERAPRPDAQRACPCGGAGRNAATPPRYEACCGRFIGTGDTGDAGAQPSTALELMCSRYSAYVLRDTAYLRATWAAATCPADLGADLAADEAAVPRWLGLQIKRHVQRDARHAEVEFVARYKVGGRAHRLHENSRFERGDDGRWRYVDGDLFAP